MDAWHPAFRRDDGEVPLRRLDRMVRAAGWLLLALLVLCFVAAVVAGLGDYGRFHGD